MRTSHFTTGGMSTTSMRISGIAHWLRRHPVLLAITLVSTSSCRDASDPVRSDQSVAPAVAPLLSAGKNGIEGAYIVVLKDGSDPRSVAAVAGVHPRFVYTAALVGFSATLNPGQLTALLHNPSVSYVAENQVVTHSATQSNPIWGLDRIDQRGLPLDNQFIYGVTGQGVRAYVIDSGIRTDHSQFSGRASVGYDALGGNGQDCDGHGTHVAGTIGAAAWGVAKDVKLIAVRIADCEWNSDVGTAIAGIDWVAANAQKPAVANMSFGGAPSVPLDDAVTRLANSGVVPVAAAGNQNQNACNVSPARAAAAITVGATDSNDARAVYSNWGSCVNIFAPGNNIVSASIADQWASEPGSGTSMAAPHVAGLAALYLQTKPSSSPATVIWALTRAASTGKVIDPAGSSNRMAYLLNPPSGCGRLLPGEALRRNQWANEELRSCTGSALLALQTDQNVVLYDGVGPLWAAPNTLNRGTMVLQMQPDGNLVAYAVPATGSGPWQPLWSSNTPGNLNAWLAIQDDCNLVIYRGPFPYGNGVLWASNTSCRVR